MPKTPDLDARGQVPPAKLKQPFANVHINYTIQKRVQLRTAHGTLKKTY